MIQCNELDPHPIVYRTFMMCLSVLTPLINGYAIFCIIRKSTTQMASYKWWLLAYQLASSAYDFVFTTLTLPVVFFPITMAYCDSFIARWISLSTEAALRIFVFCIALLLITILDLFLYRCHVLIPHNHVMKMSKNGRWVISIALLVIFYAPLTFSVVSILPDQDEAKRWVMEEYSCARAVLDDPLLQIGTPSSIQSLAIVAAMLDIFATFVAIYSISLSFYFLSKTDHMSQKTKLMQRRYLISLCVQVSIPLVTLLIPILVLIFTLSAELGQSVGNFGVGCMGFHGITAPLSLIFCNDTYRRFTLDRFSHIYSRSKQSSIADVTVVSTASKGNTRN